MGLGAWGLGFVDDRIWCCNIPLLWRRGLWGGGLLDHISDITDRESKIMKKSPLERGNGLKENAQRSSFSQGVCRKRQPCFFSIYKSGGSSRSNTPLTASLNALQSVSSPEERFGGCTFTVCRTQIEFTLFINEIVILRFTESEKSHHHEKIPDTYITCNSSLYNPCATDRAAFMGRYSASAG